jgi:hypothetical protein
VAFEGLRAAVVSQYMDRRTAAPEEPVPESTAPEAKNGKSPRNGSTLNGNATKGSASSQTGPATIPIAEEGAAAH